MDNAAFYKFQPQAQCTEGITHILIEMYRIGRRVKIVNDNPECVIGLFNN